jgi:porphobilinogen synthase
MRRLVAEQRLHPAELVLPLFVKEGAAAATPVGSMPGVVQHTRDTVRKAAAEAAGLGLGGVMLFGVPVSKDAAGSGATDPDGVLNVAVRDVREEVGDALVVMADLCLDEFTDHGHCGVLAADGSVDNDATLVRYADTALALAEAGAHVVGTSGMMDGQVGAVRAALDGAGRSNVAVLAYAAKYASTFYGPFRDAVESSLVGDRRTYQQDPANGREALREVALDLADAASVDVPVAAYQVSGEYSMIEAAAARGWLDRERTIVETLTSIKRAGASFVLTYWASEVAGWLRR